MLALPPEDGFNLAVYLVPAGIVLAGGAAIGVIALRRRERPPAAADGPAIAEDDAGRLDEDLRRYEL